MGLLIIARFTIQEAFHRWLLLAMLILNLLLLIAFTLLLNAIYPSIAPHSATQAASQVQSLGFSVAISVLATWAVYLLSGALTVLLTVGMTSSEIESGTITMIITKPLRRLEFIFGKWLGYGLIICIYTAMLFGTFLGVIYWITGYWPQQAFQALAMIEISSLVLLALTTLGSACLPTLVNGAIVIILFIGVPLASFVQFIATNAGASAQNIVTVISLILPTDALWHGASFYLIPPTAFLLMSSQQIQQMQNPFISFQPIAPGLLIWALAYCLVLPIIGVLRFQRRDL